MTPAPREVYAKARRQTGGFEPVGRTAMGLLKELGDRELPDARLTAKDRELLKFVIAWIERYLGVDGLLFTAAGCEVAAHRKHASEEAGRS